MFAGPLRGQDRGGSSVLGSSQAGAGALVWQLTVPTAQGISSAAVGQPHDLLWCADAPPLSTANVPRLELQAVRLAGYMSYRDIFLACAGL